MRDHRNILVILFGLVMLAASSNALAATTPSVPSTAGYVQTPSGFAHPSCVHQIPDGAEIDTSDNLVKNGAVIAHYDPCPYPVIRPNASSASGSSNPILPNLNGWVEWAEQDFNSPPYQQWNAIVADFVVPQNPPSNGGVVYFFTALETTGQPGVIQPVLQWGYNNIFGGNYWTLSSWAVRNSNNFYYSTVLNVHPGDTIATEMYIENTSFEWEWYILAWDITTNQSTHADYWINNLENRAFPGAIEAYNVSSCNQLPYGYSGGYIEFYNIALYVPGTGGIYTYQQLGLNAGIAYGQTEPQCGYGVLVYGVNAETFLSF